MSEYKEVPSFEDYSGNGAFVSQPETVAVPKEGGVLIDKPKKSAEPLGGVSAEFISFLHELPNDEIHLALYLKKLDQSTDPQDEAKIKMMYDLANIVPGIPKSFTYDDGVAMRAILDYKNSFNL